MADSPFRGPEGRLHVPSYRKACWHGRPSGCCALCYLRLIGAIVRGVVR